MLMTLKQCSKCKESKPNSIEFYGKRPPSHLKTPSTDPYLPECKPCRNQRVGRYVKANRDKVNLIEQRTKARRREWINSLKYSPCADCGIQYPPYVMDFDHLPEYNKGFAISEALGSKKISKARVLEEINKCQLVCANCHRIRSHNRISDNKGEDAMLASIREEVELKEALERDVLDSIKAGSKFAHEE